MLSTISGTPWRLAISPHFAISTTLPAGLPIDSTNSARVLSSISDSIFA